MKMKENSREITASPALSTKMLSLSHSLADMAEKVNDHDVGLAKRLGPQLYQLSMLVGAIHQVIK